MRVRHPAETSRALKSSEIPLLPCSSSENAPTTKTDGWELTTVLFASSLGGCSTAIENGELKDYRQTSEIFIEGSINSYSRCEPHHCLKPENVALIDLNRLELRFPSLNSHFRPEALRVRCKAGYTVANPANGIDFL